MFLPHSHTSHGLMYHTKIVTGSAEEQEPWFSFNFVVMWEIPPYNL